MGWECRFWKPTEPPEQPNMPPSPGILTQGQRQEPRETQGKPRTPHRQTHPRAPPHDQGDSSPRVPDPQESPFTTQPLPTPPTTTLCCTHFTKGQALPEPTHLIKETLPHQPNYPPQARHPRLPGTPDKTQRVERVSEGWERGRRRARDTKVNRGGGVFKGRRGFPLRWSPVSWEVVTL